MLLSVSFARKHFVGQSSEVILGSVMPRLGRIFLLRLLWHRCIPVWPTLTGSYVNDIIFRVEHKIQLTRVPVYNASVAQVDRAAVS